jgi:crossover junction endodeoxyribonuclease RuvC
MPYQAGVALYLGIDPGLASTGWGLLDTAQKVVACGTIRTAPGPDGPRLAAILTALESVLADHPVGEAALEELFFGKNRTSVIGVAQARGVVLLALERAGIPCFQYKPATVKSVLTGYGAAGKEQMARMLAMQVGGAGKLDDHAVDAIAIAVFHAPSRRLRLAAAPGGRAGGRALPGPPEGGVPPN